MIGGSFISINYDRKYYIFDVIFTLTKLLKTIVSYVIFRRLLASSRGIF